MRTPDIPPPARERMSADAELAAMLHEWAPDEAQRKSVLADDPRRRYGFA